MTCCTPGGRPVERAADQVAGAVEPCLDARSAPAGDDEQIPVDSSTTATPTMSPISLWI